MRAHSVGLVLLAGAFALAACESNPVLGPGDDGGHEHEIFVELTLSASHVHILSPITFTVAVTNDHGDPVTDFEVLEVQRLAVGSDTWRGTDLTRNGAVYEADYTFMSSGEYRLRVVGQRPGEAEGMVLYEMAESIQAARAHAEAGGMRVEFETFPGHLHTHNMAQMKFWIMEPERNEAGERPAIPGLATTVVCNEPDGGVEQHAAVEEAAGVYVAEHEFESEGDFVAQIRFLGTDGNEAVAEFTTHVVPAH